MRRRACEQSEAAYTIAAYRKLADNKDQLSAYREAVAEQDSLPEITQPGFLFFVVAGGLATVAVANTPTNDPKTRGIGNGNSARNESESFGRLATLRAGF